MNKFNVWRGGGLYSKVHAEQFHVEEGGGGGDSGWACKVTANAPSVMVTWDLPPVDWQTELKTLPSTNFAGGR